MKDYSLWWDASGEPRERRFSRPPPTALDARSADIAVVGAGYTGLAAARQLAAAGASVVVLERERIGWGASSRNAGQVLTGLRLEPATLVARYGEERARELFAVSLDAIAGLEAFLSSERIQCEYERNGHIQAAWKPSHFEAFRKEQSLLARVFGHSVRLVPRSEQSTELASESYHGLLIDERSGAINPVKYIDGLAAAARRAGVLVYEGAAVQHIARTGSRWRITTGAGSLDADDVLLATDGYTDAAAPGLQRRLVPIGSYIIATEPLGDAAERLLPNRRTAFDSKHFLYYFRVTPDRRLLFGGRAEFGQPNEEANRRAAAILEQGMRSVFPQIDGARVEYGWSGNVAFTRDQMPHAGRLDGIWFAAGYCGHGVAMATHLGSMIARRIAGEPIEHPLFDDRFAAIPLYSGRPWFLPLVGAYYRVKDLVE